MGMGIACSTVLSPAVGKGSSRTPDQRYHDGLDKNSKRPFQTVFSLPSRQG